jgi:hypothetical protein
LGEQLPGDRWCKPNSDQSQDEQLDGRVALMQVDR